MRHISHDIITSVNHRTDGTRFKNEIPSLSKDQHHVYIYQNTIYLLKNDDDDDDDGDDDHDDDDDNDNNNTFHPNVWGMDIMESTKRTGNLDYLYLFI